MSDGTMIFIAYIILVICFLFITGLFYAPKQRGKPRKDDLLYELGAVEFSLSRVKTEQDKAFFEAKKENLIRALEENLERRLEKARKEIRNGK